MLKFLIVLILFLIDGIFSEKMTENNRVIVIVDSSTYQITHSVYFEDLRGNDSI